MERGLTREKQIENGYFSKVVSFHKILRGVVHPPMVLCVNLKKPVHQLADLRVPFLFVKYFLSTD